MTILQEILTLQLHMAQFTLKGMGVALITPFRTDRSIDTEALDRMIEHIVVGGADFIVVLGTTAETPTLSDNEKRMVRRQVAARVRGRIPLVAGMGGNNTSALSESFATEDLSGYEAILSVVPYYNKPTQEGIYRHYRAIAEASPLPVILYNVPGRTGANMNAETVLRLAHEEPRIIGVKEASGRSDQIQAILTGRPEGFELISGDDALTYPLMQIGASGVISVIGNAFTREFSNMVHLTIDGRLDEAGQIHDCFDELYKLMFVDGNPAGVKAALHHMGLIENVLRLPLVEATSGTAKRIGEIIDSFDSRR